MKIYMIVLQLVYMTVQGLGQGTIGSIIWKPYFEIGKSLYVYKLGPDCDVNGVREKLTGGGYSAQLWYSLAQDVDPSSLKPISNLDVVTFTGSGFMAFPLKIDVQGTYGGDRVHLQFRVWENRNNTVLSWQQAVSDPSIAKGVSPLIQDYMLSGVNQVGTPVPGQSLPQPEFTICAVPEPSTFSIAAFSAVGLALSLGRGARARSG